MKYKQLTAAQGGVVEGLLHTRCTLKEIARILGVSSSTVSREIKKRE